MHLGASRACQRSEFRRDSQQSITPPDAPPDPELGAGRLAKLLSGLFLSWLWWPKQEEQCADQSVGEDLPRPVPLSRRCIHVELTFKQHWLNVPLAQHSTNVHLTLQVCA